MKKLKLRQHLIFIPLFLFTFLVYFSSLSITKEEDEKDGRNDLQVPTPVQQFPRSSSILTCLEEYSNGKQFRRLSNCIKDMNSLNPIQNPNLSSKQPKVIITIIAHKRHEYLFHVLKALERVDGIKDDALLVISHDGYFPQVHQLVQDISFCRYIQIYHPFSKDLARASFQIFRPQEDERPDILDTGVRKTILELAIDDNIVAETSFIADPHLVQSAAKHHYWWLWNYLFRLNLGLSPEEQKCLPSDGKDFYSIFLEEDHYVTPDLITTFLEMKQIRYSQCPECIGLNMGYHTSDINAFSPFIEYELLQYSVLGNIGLAFSKHDFLTHIYENGETFCTFNDYNWDLTMFYMEHRQIIPETALTPRLPRVYHIGLCGMHIKSTSGNCGPETFIQELQQKIIQPLHKAKESQFDPHLQTQMKLLKDDKWIQERYSKHVSIGGVEGWTSGKMWGDGVDQKGNKIADHLWKSEINRNHCQHLSTSQNL